MAAKEDLGEGLSNGEQSPFVKLISAEGHEFFVDRKCALVSGTIRSMLQSKSTNIYMYICVRIYVCMCMR